jgi:DNA-binding transcriptional LysR family regulator
MDLTRLRYFQAVAEELHFGRAAARLHIAQPPLSRQIRVLEQELGVRLFDRSTRRVGLTEAGRFIYPEVRRLLIDAATIERRLEEFRAGEGGTLRLGFVDSSSYEILPRFLRLHRGRWSKVDYELSSMSSDEQRAALLDGRIDLGMVRVEGHDPALTATILEQESLVLAVGADHRLVGTGPVSLAATAGEAFIGFDRRISPSLHAQLHELLARRGIEYDPVIEATEYTTILGLVASGQGAAIVPAGVRSFRPTGLHYIELHDDDAVSSVLLLSRSQERSPLVRRAIEVAGEMFGDG